jgi:putative salt-induced outer membrane protein YdiY
MNRHAQCGRPHSRIILALTSIVFAAMLGNAEDAHCQDEKKLGWFSTAEFTAIWTGGNSESSTFGLTGTLHRAWTKSDFKFRLGGTQTQSTLKTRTAVGTSTTDFQVIEEKTTEKTAEYYFARARYDYEVSKHFLVFGGVDWLRNTFSGIDSRFLLAAGAGNIVVDREAFRLGTDYGVTYTFEEDVVDNPFLKNNFPGVRFGYDLWWRLSSTTEFISDFILDWNLDNTDDVRIDFTNSLPIAISEKLAFKPAFKMLWRNDPALTTVSLFASDGTPTGETVAIPLEELDTVATIALVMKI